jgi:hypothetical protein
VLYDLKNGMIDFINPYKIPSMKKYSVDSVIYDDRITSCFYNKDTHPYSTVFSELFLNMCMTFHKCGMTVLYDKRVDDTIYVDIFPSHKVKDFKE